MEPTTYLFKPKGGIPNSALPLLVWPGRLPADGRNGRAACALFERNGWSGTWVDTFLPFWHFHTRGHEVLACVSGGAEIGFGGENGVTLDVNAGDVCLVPAGVAHRRGAASADFQMAGGYPPGQQGNIFRVGEMDDAQVEMEIATLALPQRDPVSGLANGVVEYWRGP